VRRQTDAGYEEVECVLPCLVTLTAGVVEPRYPSFAGIMMAKHKPIEEVTVADLGIAPEEVGWAGARQEIVDIVVTEQRTAGEVIEDRGDGHQQILQLLEQLKII